MAKLTNDTVRTLPVRGSDTLYADAEVPGLYLRLRSGGSRTFIIQWRQGQLQRRSTVGKVGVLTVDEARKKARKLLVGIDEGNDPVAVKAKARADDKQLFGVLAEEYLSLRAKDMKPLSLEQTTLHLRKYWKPLHRLPLKKIDRATVAAELRVIGKDRGPVAADRGRSSISSFFAWAIGEGLAEANPVFGTNKASKGASRERVLTAVELVKIWKAAPASDYGRIVKLLMLTGQRREEVSAMRRSELQDGVLCLPAERTKNSRSHDIPLSALALAVLSEQAERAGRDFVFGEGEGGFSGFSKSKERLDKASGVTEWTLHDLRRTLATGMAELGVQPHIIEAVLNHVSGHKAGVAGVYNRSSYAAEKRAALDLWGNYVQLLLAEAEGANVQALRRASL
jgi:integrase